MNKQCIQHIERLNRQCEAPAMNGDRYCMHHSPTRKAKLEKQSLELAKVRHENWRVGQWLRKFDPEKFKEVIGYLVLTYKEPKV